MEVIAEKTKNDVIYEKSLIFSTNLSLRFWEYLRIYSSILDEDILGTLEKIKKMCGEESWAYIEKLEAYRHRKIEYHLEKFWEKIRGRKISEFCNNELESDLDMILKIIKATENSYLEIGFGRKFWLDEFYLELAHLRNYIKLQPAENESIITIYKKEKGIVNRDKFKVVYIPVDDDGKDIVNVTPPEEIAEDDRMGQQLRDMLGEDASTISKIAYISINAWLFPVFIKDSNGDYCLRVEDLLSVLGGCFRGYNIPTTDHKCLSQQGYSFQKKSCECPLVLSCPAGRRIIQSGTLSALAKKLRYIQEINSSKKLIEFMQNLEK